MNSPKTKKILKNIAPIAVVFGLFMVGYFIFFKKDSPTPEEASLNEEVIQTVIVGAEVTRTIFELQNLKSSAVESVALFGNPAFKTLEDFSQIISEEPIGRGNPFAPTDWKIQQEAKKKALGGDTTSGI